MSVQTFFITATDTDAGKTLVSCAMLIAAREKGLSTAALKPVAAGVISTNESVQSDAQNEDVIALASCCSLPLTFKEINPVCFPEPVAPHIGAAKLGPALDATMLSELCQPTLNKQANLTVIEGAGGWRVPLSESETMADLVRVLGVPVILVVGMRLGCLNHALLTAESIQAEGVPFAGWIANRIDPNMQAYAENLTTLQTMMPAPLIAEIPWLDSDSGMDEAASYIDLTKLGVR
jgi:dethiobiotin synthetase